MVPAALAVAAAAGVAARSCWIAHSSETRAEHTLTVLGTCMKKPLAKGVAALPSVLGAGVMPRKAAKSAYGSTSVQTIAAFSARLTPSSLATRSSARVKPKAMSSGRKSIGCAFASAWMAAIALDTSPMKPRRP